VIKEVDKADAAISELSSCARLGIGSLCVSRSEFGSTAGQRNRLNVVCQIPWHQWVHYEAPFIDR